MSAEPSANRPAPIRQPAGLATGTERLSRLVALSRAIAAERVSQRMLRVASRELTELLDAEACLISQLEDPQSFVVAVVLAGKFAGDRELASFLTESYPGLRVIDESGERDPNAYLPVYG